MSDTIFESRRPTCKAGHTCEVEGCDHVHECGRCRAETGLEELGYTAENGDVDRGIILQ